MSKKVNTKIPMKFELVEDVDSRFQKVKIWLMHLGVNYNNSYFSKEVVLEYMHTLKNTPLLGFIEEGKLGKDFKGHEEILVVKDGEISTKYLGSAYGMIPESCNPRFEFKAGDDGLVREYLVVDALLWTKFQDAVDILNESDEVGQSMELHDEYDGYWSDENIFVFTEFKFDGACMLGKGISPAMQKASVEKVFSVDVIQKQIEQKLYEYEEYIQNKYSTKEVEVLTIEELLAKYSVTQEQLAEKEIDIQNFSLEELESKIKEVFSKEDDNNEDEKDKENEDTDNSDENKVDDNKEADIQPDNVDENETGDGADNGEDNPESNFQLKDELLDRFKKRFEISHDDLRWKIYETLDSHINTTLGTESWFYISSVFDDYFIAEDDYGNSFFKVSYGKSESDVTLGEVKQVFPMFLTNDEKGALELMRTSFDSYEAENKELKEFKANVEKETHQAKAEELFSKFSLEEDDLTELRAKVSEYSLEELESKTFEILGRKMATAKFSKKEPKVPVTVKFTHLENEEPVGKFDKYFDKHGVQ